MEAGEAVSSEKLTVKREKEKNSVTNLRSSMSNWKSGRMLPLIVVAALLLVGGAIQAQDAAQKTCDWHYELDLVAWGTSLSGTVGPTGNASMVDASFGSILNYVDMAGQLHFEANNGTWGILVDPYYANLGDDTNLPNGYPANLKIKEFIAGLAGSYRLYKGPTASFDLTFGGRYNQLSADVTPRGGPTSGSDITWIDPVIGFRVGVQMSRVWAFGFRADVGGFAFGSKLTWSGAVRFDAQVSKSLLLSFGYINLYTDYVKSAGPTGRGTFEYAMTMGGPYLGVGFKF